MDWLISVLTTTCIGLIVLGVLVIVHEGGHFLVAKLCGVGVLEFSIGFGKKIWQKRINGTRYAVGIMPLGGYVRMVGDDPYQVYGEEKQDQDKDKNPDNILQPIDDTEDEDVKKMLADKSRWFLERGFFSKFAIVLAGPAFNIIFAVLLSIVALCIYGVHRPVHDPIIGSIFEKMDFPAEKAGLKAGDKVLSINGKAMATWGDIVTTVRNSDGSEMTFVIERKVDDALQELSIVVTPIPESPEMAIMSDNDKGSKTKQEYIIGIGAPLGESESITFAKAVVLGSRYVFDLSIYTLKSLKLLVTGEVSAKHLGGPIAIVQAAGSSAEKGGAPLFKFVVFLSVSLAILNLLPIPILDGGHLMFFIVGAIKGLFTGKSSLDIKTQEFANRLGLAFLMALMLFAIGNDIFRLFN
ncbi:MAG: RIP metalloprotease RseP [Bdellovibrionota bacterium]